MRRVRIETRHEFAYGFTSSRATRLGAAIAITVVGVPISFGAGLLFGLVLAFVVNPDGSFGVAIVVAIAPALLGAGLFGVWGVVNILRVTRTSAWLEGTRLTVQHVFPNTVDLARARSVEIRLTRMLWRTPGARTGTIPELVVAGDSGIVRMRLSTGEGQPLPAHDIAALVSVLSSTGAPGAGSVVQFLRIGY